MGIKVKYWDENGFCQVDKKIIEIIKVKDVLYEDREVMVEGYENPIKIRNIVGYQKILGLGR